MTKYDSLPHRSIADIAVMDCSVFQTPEVYSKALLSVNDVRRKKIAVSRSEDRFSSLGVGCLADYLLKKYGIASSALVFAEDGKPFLPGTGYYLSLSHAGSYAMAGISSEPVGVDLESFSSPSDGIASHFFTSEENDFLASTTDRTKEFFRLWSRKECIIKRDGFREIRRLPALTAPKGTRFFDFPLDGYSCVAYLSENITPQFQFISLDDLFPVT